MCIWFPEWPLRRPDAPWDRACIVTGEREGRLQIVAANRHARTAGVRLGMDRREAEGLVPAGISLDRDLGQEALRFEPVLSAVEELIPRVEVVEPGWLFVPLTGAIRYFGGEGPLLDRVAKEVDAASGGGGRFGVAGGPFAAYWASRIASEDDPLLVVVENDARFLAGLDIGALGVENLVATFRWLGIHTLGALADLPRPAIASRFGTEGLSAHQLASGEDRPPRPRDIPVAPTVEERYEEPLVLLEQVGFAARSLANRLLEGLRPYGIAPHRILVEAEAADGTVRSRVWRSADPFSGESLSERVWWQLRAWVETAGVPGGVVRLQLAPDDLSGSGRQMALFENVAARIDAERAVARVQAILGPDAVLESRPRGGRNPTQQVQWHRWGEPPAHSMSLDAPWPGRIPVPSPALVPPEPRVIEVEWEAGMPERVRLGSRWEPVLTWAGPWRQVADWWRGEAPLDHYQIVTSAGAMLCAVVDGVVRLVGVYD